jgi:hypothetical protein
MIEDLKQLEKLLKLCRKQGVDSIELEGLKLKFGEMPIKREAAAEVDTEEAEEMSDEKLLDWALGAGH